MKRTVIIDSPYSTEDLLGPLWAFITSYEEVEDDERR
jgi:hypothetical protein